MRLIRRYSVVTAPELKNDAKLHTKHKASRYPMCQSAVSGNFLLHALTDLQHHQMVIRQGLVRRGCKPDYCHISDTPRLIFPSWNHQWGFHYVYSSRSTISGRMSQEISGRRINSRRTTQRHKKPLFHSTTVLQKRTQQWVIILTRIPRIKIVARARVTKRISSWIVNYDRAEKLLAQRLSLHSKLSQLGFHLLCKRLGHYRCISRAVSKLVCDIYFYWINAETE